MAELLQRCDEEGNPLGPVDRHRAHGDPAIIHLTVHLHVFHPDGRLYLQRRSPRKDLYPGVWDTAVGGHVDAGEDVHQALLREAQEELGIDARPARLLHRYLHRNAHESEYVHSYGLRYAGPFELNPEEISEGRFHTIEEIVEHLGTGTFTPNFEEEFRSLQAAGRMGGP